MTDEHVPVRLSHLLRDCSVGAIVRGPDSLMVVQDIRTWERPGSDPLEREIRYVDRVRSALGIERVLRAPPRSAERNGTVIGWVPALRFPSWIAVPDVRVDALRHRGGDRGRKTTITVRTPKQDGAGVAPDSAVSAAEGWSRRRGSLCTKTAIWRMSLGTTWPTEASRKPEQRLCRPDWRHSLPETG